jgi:hypothetical protein
MGGNADERTAIGTHGRLPYESDVGLVDQRRRLQRVTRPLATQIRVSDPAQLMVDRRY